MASEKTEAATPKRKKDARSKGQVAKSQELVSLGVLLAAVIAFRFLGPRIWGDLRGIVVDGLSQPARTDLTTETTYEFGRSNGLRALTVLAPLMAVLSLAAIGLSVMQTGLNITSHNIKPRMSAINPAAGTKRLFSKQGLMNLAKAISKMAIVGIVVWMTMSSRFAEFATLSEYSVPQAAGRLGSIGLDLALRTAIVLFFLALIDYGWQRRQYNQQLRMSKEEVKQEMRESDGDPQIKNAIRRRRQALMNRMMSAVPTADVVVTNPTHYAVAIKYDPISMAAPIVVAKGEQLLALRIREVAKKAGIPVLEEPPLARALYAAVPIGHPVPANLFHAVAEVLAWVYAVRSGKPFDRRRNNPRTTAAQGAL